MGAACHCLEPPKSKPPGRQVQASHQQQPESTHSRPDPKTSGRGKPLRQLNEESKQNKQVARETEERRIIQLQREEQQLRELKKQLDIKLKDLQRREQQLQEKERKETERRQTERDDRQSTHKQVQKKEHELQEMKQPNRYSYNVFDCLVQCTSPKQGWHQVKCSSCQSARFSGLRLHCLSCPATDFCGVCFEAGVLHESRHAMALAPAVLNQAGEKRLLGMKSLFGKKGVERQVGLTWLGYCEVCCSRKQSFFLSESESGLNVCKSCYEGRAPDLHFIADIFPVYSKVELEGFRFEGDAFTPERRVSRIVNKTTGHVFALNEVLVRVRRSNYYSLRNQLLSYRTNQFVTVFAYEEQLEPGGKVRLLMIQEWMPGLTLRQLVLSKQYKAFSSRRKLGIARSLASALRLIHNTDLTYRYLRPENIWLDACHEAKLEATPFVNSEAVLLSVLLSHPYTEPNSAGNADADIYSFGLVLNYIFSGVDHSLTAQGQLIFPRQCAYFKDLVGRCTGMSGRPSAASLEEYFKSCERQFWHGVEERMSLQAYQRLSIQEKQALFKDLYKGFSDRLY